MSHGLLPQSLTVVAIVILLPGCTISERRNVPYSYYLASKKSGKILKEWDNGKYLFFDSYVRFCRGYGFPFPIAVGCGVEMKSFRTRKPRIYGRDTWLKGDPNDPEIEMGTYGVFRLEPLWKRPGAGCRRGAPRAGCAALPPLLQPSGGPIVPSGAQPPPRGTNTR